MPLKVYNEFFSSKFRISRCLAALFDSIPRLEIGMGKQAPLLFDQLGKALAGGEGEELVKKTKAAPPPSSRPGFIPEVRKVFTEAFPSWAHCYVDTYGVNVGNSSPRLFPIGTLESDSWPSHVCPPVSASGKLNPATWKWNPSVFCRV